MMTRKEVAIRAGVSVGTVSNVINRKKFVKPELVKRVQNAIAELNYVPDYNAKSLASKRSKHLGIALYEMSNPYHVEIIKGIESYAAEHGYIVTIFLLENEQDKKMDAICERRLEGLINFMTNDFPGTFTDILLNQNITLVNFLESNSFTIKNHYRDSMLFYMQRLQELGHKNVAYIWGFGKERFIDDDRGKVFLSEREHFGFCMDEDLIVYHTQPDVLSQDCGYDLCGKLLQKHKEVTAIFAFNDLAAMGVIRKLSELGYRCPQDISVIGCDGISLGQCFVPSISTITFDKMQCGREIAKCVIDHIENPQDNPYRTIDIFSVPKEGESVAAVKG